MVLHKSVSAIVRRPDLDREAFRAYYEERHAPLAVRHFPFARYVRNHVIEEGECGFDVLSEFWFADPGELAAVLEGPVGPAIRRDELRFMDKPRNRPASAREVILSPHAGAPAAVRSLHLLDWPGDDPAMAAAAAEWARQLAARAAGVSLDIVAPHGPSGFPARALVWCDADRDAVPPPAPAGVTLSRIAVRRIETPPRRLPGGRAQAG